MQGAPKMEAQAFLNGSASIFERMRKHFFVSAQKKQFIVMAKFRFVKRKNLQKKDDPGKWYASPIVENRMNTGTVCRLVTRNTTTAPTELESGFNLVCDAIPLQLQTGNSVQLGRLGILRLSFGSSGVDNIDDFNAASMIRGVKVIFTPSKELMSAIKDGLSFENAGVVDNGFIYATTRAFKEAQGGGGSTPGGGGGGNNPDGDLEDNPLG